MTAVIPQDTPITRATIEKMDDEQLKLFVEGLQERRLKAYSIFEQGQEAKKKAKYEKDAALLQKRLDQFLKKYESVVKGLETIEKYALEIQALRLTTEYGE